MEKSVVAKDLQELQDRNSLSSGRKKREINLFRMQPKYTMANPSGTLKVSLGFTLQTEGRAMSGERGAMSV